MAMPSYVLLVLSADNFQLENFQVDSNGGAAVPHSAQLGTNGALLYFVHSPQSSECKPLTLSVCCDAQVHLEEH